MGQSPASYSILISNLDAESNILISSQKVSLQTTPTLSANVQCVKRRGVFILVLAFYRNKLLHYSPGGIKAICTETRTGGDNDLWCTLHMQQKGEEACSVLHVHCCMWVITFTEAWAIWQGEHTRRGKSAGTFTWHTPWLKNSRPGNCQTDFWGSRYYSIKILYYTLFPHLYFLHN